MVAARGEPAGPGARRTMRDLRRRVRWGNVARAVGAVLALTAVVAWARLSPGAPRLPSDGAEALIGGARPGDRGASVGSGGRRTERAPDGRAQTNGAGRRGAKVRGGGSRG